MKKFLKLPLITSLAFALSACGETEKPTDALNAETESPSKDLVAKSPSEIKDNLVLAENYVEGVHYSVLEKPFVKPKNSVIELFSLTCPHCLNAEIDLMTEWKKDENIKFQTGHAVFKVKHNNEEVKAWSKEAKMLFALEKMNRKDLLIDLFKVRQSKGFNDGVLSSFLTNNNVNDEEFFFIMNSEDAEKYVDSQILISEKSTSKSVPTFIVSGKYLIDLRSIRSFDDVRKISEFLIRKQP